MELGQNEVGTHPEPPHENHLGVPVTRRHVPPRFCGVT